MGEQTRVSSEKQEKDGTVLQKNNTSVEKLSEINPFNLITQAYLHRSSTPVQS